MYQFIVSTEKPTRADAKKMRSIARRHGACLVEADMPEGYRRWFECPNSGAPFDGATANAVRSDLQAAGIIAE